MEKHTCFVCGAKIDPLKASYVSVRIKRKNINGLRQVDTSFPACFKHVDDCLEQVEKHVHEFKWSRERVEA